MNATPETVIDVEGLTKSFGHKTVVRNLSLKVARGTIYGFLGPNGSGKTTTIRMICGLLTPDSGHGTTLGFDILTQADEIKRQVGYMTQRFSLYQDLSVRENLELVARIYQIKKPKEAAREMIERHRPERARGTTCGRTFRRLEAAPRTRRLHVAESRSCFCLTSRPRASIRKRGANSGTRFTRWPHRASPFWSRRTTWTRPNAATRSRTSPMANCWRTAPSTRSSRAPT